MEKIHMGTEGSMGPWGNGRGNQKVSWKKFKWEHNKTDQNLWNIGKTILRKIDSTKSIHEEYRNILNNLIMYLKNLQKHKKTISKLMRGEK